MAQVFSNENNQLPDFIKNSINREIEIATKEELERAKNRIEERESEIIAGVILHVQRSISFKTMGTELIITVQTPK